VRAKLEKTKVTLEKWIQSRNRRLQI